jgi:multimeric flavodoxin WrbA
LKKNSYRACLDSDETSPDSIKLPNGSSDARIRKGLKPDVRLLGLSCSPRRRGNTDLLLGELLKGAQDQGADTEKFDVCRLRIAACRGCGRCETAGECRIRDGMQGMYLRIEDADAIALASPIYFYNVTGQCKVLIDRCQVFWSRKYALKQSAPPKTGFFLSVGATQGKRMFDCASLTVRYFFDAINATYSGHLLFAGIDEKGDIRKHPTALEEAYEAGMKLVKQHLSLETGSPSKTPCLGP